MKTQTFSHHQDGFYGVYHPSPTPSDKTLILMLSDTADNYMVKSSAKWLHKQGCNVLAMSPDKKDGGGYHAFPLESFGNAIAFIKSQGSKKIGIVGASTTGMMALLASSFYSEITLTIALTPSDFVMEGFYKGKRDGAAEWPSDNAIATWQGQPLPYLPYAYRHPEYNERVMADSKASGNMIASRPMFEESERRHPIQEAEKIKVENIRGKLILVGAEDDALWDACRYIRRMTARLDAHPHACEVETLVYEHGTHFVFPQSLLKNMLPVGSGLLIRLMFKAGRNYPAQCKKTRIDIDKRLSQSISAW